MEGSQGRILKMTRSSFLKLKVVCLPHQVVYGSKVRLHKKSRSRSTRANKRDVSANREY
jgi:hypothetical protein